MPRVREHHDQERSRETGLLSRPLRLLANSRRRAILRMLLEEGDDSIAFYDLATEILAREGGDHVIDLDVVILDLHHRQLPVLSDAGVIEYDRQSGTIRYVGDEEIEALLRPARS